MINFRKGENYQEMKSLKDFLPVSMEKFFKYRGRELYGVDLVKSTQPEGTKFTGINKGKLNLPELKSAIRNTEIEHPASHKKYKASDFIYTGKTKNFEKDFDLVFKIDKTGIIVSPEFDHYVFLMATLNKYRKSDSFDYKFVFRSSDKPSPIITIPKTKEGYTELVSALTEFCVSLYLFLGTKYYIYFIEENDPNTKYFSSVLSFIPTATSLAYSLIVKPILAKRIISSWDTALKFRYNPNLVGKLKNIIKEKYKDKLVVGDCCSCSCFMEITKARESKKMLSDPLFLAKNNIVPERRRCELDWMAYCAQGIDNDGKSRDLIMITDLDPVPAIFHEFGHFLESNQNYLGSIQRASHGLIFTDGFCSFCSFLLGFGGVVSGNGAKGEIFGWITSILLKFPTLQSEFMASYYGLQMMKKLGATEKELENAKESLKMAYSSYLVNVLGSASSSGFGRVFGETYKKLKEYYDNN